MSKLEGIQAEPRFLKKSKEGSARRVVLLVNFNMFDSDHEFEPKARHEVRTTFVTPV